MGVVIALTLLTLAGLLLARHLGAFHGPVLLTALGAGVVLAGLGVVVAGLRGRTSGFLGFLALVGLLVTMPLAGWSGWQWDGSVAHEPTVVITDAAAARHGVRTTLGDTTVDLRNLDPAGGTLQVPVSVGVGDVAVLLPPDVAVRADVSVGVGRVTWRVPNDQESSDGVGLSRTFTADGRNGVLELTVSVGTGDLSIEQGDHR